MTDFCVIIPSKTTGNLIPCLESLYRNEPLLPASDVIIIDDGIDWTEEAVNAAHGCTLIEGIKPFVFARNCNLGIKHTLPKIEITTSQDREQKWMDGPAERDVILLNDDALLESADGFSLLVEEAEKHLEYSIIGATTNVTGQLLQRPMGVGLRPVGHIAFVCVLIPARTIRLLGLLDERYDQDYGCEDRDYCEAVNRTGLKVGVHDGCYVDHGSLRSSFRGDPKTPRSFAKNFALLTKKWHTLVSG